MWMFKIQETQDDLFVQCATITAAVSGREILKSQTHFNNAGKKKKNVQEPPDRAVCTTSVMFVCSERRPSQT